LAKTEPSAELAHWRRKFEMWDLVRIALWGVSAAAALTLAVYAGSTETGHDRLRVAFLEIREIVMPTGMKPVRPLDAREGRRLAESVRGLAAEREKLLARIATLEQSVEGITGSITRVEKAARLAPPPEPAVPAEAPLSAPPAPPDEDVTSSINAPASMPNTVPMPPSPSGSNPAKAEFGLDLGSATTIEALRTAWTAALRRHGAVLEGLRPVVQMRDRARAGGPELRLVAGPLPNAAAAARLCAVMAAGAAICAPTLFDGQRLAVR
jgi:hypothetical protein